MHRPGDQVATRAEGCDWESGPGPPSPGYELEPSKGRTGRQEGYRVPENL